MQIKHLMVVVIELCNLVLFNAYIIERRAVITRSWGQRTWIDKPDTILIPSSICSSGSAAQSTQCNQMGANRESNCKCVCNAQQHWIRYKSTFGFYEDKWKCFENTKVHIHGGNCSITIEGRPTSRDLRVIPMSTPATSYYLSTLNSDCTLTRKSYLMCNGKWEQLDETLFENRLYVDIGNWNAYLEYYTDRKSTPTINGRVIKLEFQCSDALDSHTSTHCVLFKVKGTLTCSLSPTSSSSLMLSTPITPTSTVIIPLNSSPTPSTTTRLRPSPSILPTPSILPIPSIPSSGLKDSTKTPTLPGSIQTATATVSLSTIIATDVNSPTVRYENPTTWKSVKTNIVTSPTLVEHREKNKQTDDDNSAGLIAGALAGIIGLAIIIGIIVVMIRKRKNRDNDSKRTTAENEGYGRGADISLRFTNHGQRPPDEDEYSYAYTTTVPFAKTNKQISMENNTNSNQGIESDNSVANLIYGKTEELNRPASPPHHQAPLYNTLEESDHAKLDKSMIENPNQCDGPSYDSSKEPVYAKVDKGRKKKSSDNINEPLYVLERPETDHEDTTFEGLNHEPPCYHVPKGTYPDGAPVYDVLEGPEAPVYGALEGQDPHVYAALNLRENQSTFEENQGNENMVYDSVGDVINDTGDIYQQLNQSGQRDSDVYQALSYPDKTMHLSELKESHSSA